MPRNEYDQPADAYHPKYALASSRKHKLNCKHGSAQAGLRFRVGGTRHAKFHTIYVGTGLQQTGPKNGPNVLTIRAKATSPDDLSQTIEKSKRLLDLDMSAEDEPNLSVATWGRMDRFLRAYDDWMRNSKGTPLPVPKIHPGRAGAIVLHWKSGKWELLMTIPAEQNAPMTFYWDDYGTTKMKGSFADESFKVAMLPWLQ